MIGRKASIMAVLAAIAVSFVVSYVFYSTGSFALSANHTSYIEASHWKSFQVWAMEDDILSGDLAVSTDGSIDFYILTENNYRLWSAHGSYPDALYSRVGVETLNWSMMVSDEAMYFVVYSNRGGSYPERIQASLHVDSSRFLIWPLLITTVLLSAALLICMKVLQKAREEITL